MAFDPYFSFIGTMPNFPQGKSAGAGADVGLRTELMILTADLPNWLIFFITNPIDPYTQAAVLWDVGWRPFEQQERVALLNAAGPGLPWYEYTVLELTYNGVGIRFVPGFGVVKEEQRPRLEQVPVGVLRTLQSASDEGTLKWSTSDGSTGGTDQSLYYGEHPHFEVGSREILLTFPFAPSGYEPFGEGSVNSDTMILPVTGDTAPPLTLKYMGVAKEASVVIPAVGLSTGLMRYRKTFIFHYLNANIGNPAVSSDFPALTWNTYWRARDQNIGSLVDMNGATYMQCEPKSFSSINWFL